MSASTCAMPVAILSLCRPRSGTRFCNDIEFADPLVEELRCEAVMVGPYASINPESTLNRAKVINKMIVGEFEYPVSELAKGKPPAQIRNLVFKENGTINRNPLRPNLTGDELDCVPFVSRFFKDHVDIYRYKTPSEPYPFMDIMTGRGCNWGLCTYCLWVHTYVVGSTYNVRSIPNVIEEFRFIEQQMPYIRSVMIQDDTFTEDRAYGFSEAKIKAGLKLPWSCYARGNIKYEVLKSMKRAGCRNLHVGYESASNEVLKRIKKGLTAEIMTKFTEDALRAGLHIHGDFAFGFPQETMKDAQETITWACKIKPHTAQFQIMIPFPGTPFFEEMKKNGWLNADGQPDMPQFTNAQIRATAKKAYRRFYLSWHYLSLCLRDPYVYFWSRLKTISRAIPAMFWRRWEI